MDWRQEYRDKGFIVVDNVLSHDLIDAHVVEVTALLRRFGATNAGSFSALAADREDALMVAMLDHHRRSEISRRLIFNRVLLALLRQMFGSEPVLGMARSALWGPGSMRAHVDTAFRSPDPPYCICRTWCALEDIQPDSGRFYLVPGTHRTLTPHLCREVLDERPDLAALEKEIADEPHSWFRLHGLGWSYVSAKVADRILPRERTSPRLSKGDVVIFNPAVAHGTLPCRDPRLTRKMMVREWMIDSDAPPRKRPAPSFRDAQDRLIGHDDLIDITSILEARAAAR